MDVIRAMQVFSEVIRQGSFRGAGEALNLANSAVSRQVSELERWLGFKLLYRTTRAQSLTEEGRIFLGAMEELLGRLETLRSNASAQQENITGTLRVTASEFLLNTRLAPLLSTFMQTQPRVSLSILCVDRHVNLVEEGVDLAVRVGALPDSILIARHIGDVLLLLVASPEYLIKHGTPETLQDLKQHQCLIDTTARNKGKWPFRNGQRQTTVSVTGRVEANNGETILEFAKSGHGIAYLPDFIVADTIATGQLRLLLPNHQLDPLPVSLVYAQNRLMTPALRALIDFLIENYSACSAPGSMDTSLTYAARRFSCQS